MVVVRLQGGHGIQMFQYYFARILAKKNKSALKLDLVFYKSNQKNQGTTPRNFELGIFDQSFIVATQNEIHSLTQLSFFDKIINKWGFYQ